MSIIPKEVIRELILEKNFTSPDEVLTTLKEMFREVLQESLEAELDEKFGYGKYDTETKTLKQTLTAETAIQKRQSNRN